MHGWYGGWHMGWMPLWWLFGIAFLAALVWLVTATSRRGGGDTPEQILKRRYAGGEITREEYQRKLEELRR